MNTSHSVMKLLHRIRMLISAIFLKELHAIPHILIILLIAVTDFLRIPTTVDQKMKEEEVVDNVDIGAKEEYATEEIAAGSPMLNSASFKISASIMILVSSSTAVNRIIF